MATLTIADLDNGKRDLQTVSEVANSRAATATTRFGQQTPTLYEAIRCIQAQGDEVISNLGFRVPVPYVSGLEITDSRFTVTGPDGKVYAPLSAPFTAGAWDSTQWYVLQNDLNDHKLLVFDTYVEASAAAATLPDGQVIEVSQDETRAGASTRYRVDAGALVFAVNLDQLRLDLASVANGADLSGFTPERTGSSPGTVGAELKRLSRRHFYLADYGGLEAKASAMYDALQRIAGEATTDSIEIDIGDFAYTLNQDWTMPADRRVAIQGRGAVKFEGGSFLRTVHDKYSILHGFHASGAHSAFKFQAAPSQIASKDYELSSLHFAMDVGVYGVSLSGAREGTMSNCDFRSGNGIYRTLSNICYADKMLFLGLGTAILDNGNASPFSCGMHLTYSEILGCNRPFIMSECDDGQIVGCTIDYNDEGIYLFGQDGFKIFGGYIGTRTAEAATPNTSVGGVTPALNMKGGGTGSITEKITLEGVHFVGHRESAADYDCVYIENSTNVSISSGTMTFYTRNAVRYGSNVTNLDVNGVVTANRGGFGGVVFACTSVDDSTNRFHNNTITPGQGIILPFAKVYRNSGFRTEASGEAIVPAGSMTVVVPHGLSYTPSKGDVSLSSTSQEAAVARPFIAGVDATNLTLGFTTSPVLDCGISWQISKR